MYVFVAKYSVNMFVSYAVFCIIYKRIDFQIIIYAVEKKQRTDFLAPSSSISGIAHYFVEVKCNSGLFF